MNYSMYYKVIKNNRVIDVLDNLIFLKYQKKHNRMILSNEEEAQAILSSDGNHIWHEKSLHKIPVEDYDTIELVEIDLYEYEKLKALDKKTVEELIDEYTLSLLKGGIL